MQQFNDQLTPQDKMQFFFQQDGATCHTSHRSLTRVHDMFTEERTISKGLYPPRSPDLLSCDFYLWRTLKQKVYANNHHNLDQIKENITNATRRITREELQAVSANVVKRAQKMHRFQRGALPAFFITLQVNKTIFYNTTGNLNNERMFLFSTIFFGLLLSGPPCRRAVSTENAIDKSGSKSSRAIR